MNTEIAINSSSYKRALDEYSIALEEFQENLASGNLPTGTGRSIALNAFREKFQVIYEMMEAYPKSSLYRWKGAADILFSYQGMDRSLAESYGATPFRRP